jgi:hypothetical protein
MIAVDTNVLVYAHRAEAPLHGPGFEELRALSEGPAAWAIPVFALGEFLRVVTHPAVFRPPSKLPQALGFLDGLLASPSLQVLSPGPRYWLLLRETIADSGARGNSVFDAQIAAVCREHGVPTILTEDREFRRFSGISIRRLRRS